MKALTGRLKEMDKEKKVSMVLGIFLIFLLGGILGASPRMPSSVHCENTSDVNDGINGHVFDNKGVKCSDCFVQIIYTEDKKINLTNKEGGTTGDDILLKTMKTGKDDFYSGMFSDSLDLVYGDKIYARAWDSE